MFCFINFQFFEITTLCPPKYVCFEYQTLPKDIQQLTYNDFGTHHADSNMHHVKIKLWHSGNIHSRFSLHF